MRPLFPRWSDSALWTALALGGGALLGLPVAILIWVRTPYVTGMLQPVEQPVQFDHRHHVLDDGIDCFYCHWLAAEAPTAGIPPTETCMGCHAQIWSGSPLLEPVRRSWFGAEPIRWRRVHALPDFVFFDHAVHVRNGIGCSSCHGAVETMPLVYAVHPLTMQWCLDCHRDPAPHLRPPERATDIGWTPPGDPAEQQALAQRLRVNPPTHCTGCHR
jgi:hypothetical protein